MKTGNIWLLFTQNIALITSFWMNIDYIGKINNFGKKKTIIDDGVLFIICDK